MVLKKWMSSRWLVFALVFAWKAALLLFSAQPVPANDAFFYDGPVVNYLLHGEYVNPSLVMAFPISGTEVFSAYPPLYQLVLLSWMHLFGTAALSAMSLHLVLFGIYMLVILAILNRLHTPIWCVHIAGAFLLVLTFHDRPDSVAHVFGMLSVYAWLRSRGLPLIHRWEKNTARWTWAAVAFVLLSLGTSLQIGGIYFLWVCLGMVATTLGGNKRFPTVPMLVMVALPIMLMLLVVVVFPNLWGGFMEHARQTPSLTGWRWPRMREVLKVARTVPGVIAVAFLLPWLWFKQWKDSESPVDAAHELLVMTGLLTTLSVVVASLTLMTPNMVTIAAYVQPLLVAAYLALRASLMPGKRWVRAQAGAFLLLMLLGSIRALGMTTWGLACAEDVSYASAIQLVRNELQASPSGSTVALSSAYLYEASRHNEIRTIHSDWLGRPSDWPGDEREALIVLKPAKLILTQFDYYRWYERIIMDLRKRPDFVKVDILNTARIRPPDAFKPLQRVVQHVSWAPVVVRFSWN